MSIKSESVEATGHLTMSCRWAYITSLVVGDAKLALFRTIRASTLEGQSCPTHGYFIKVYFKVHITPTSSRETSEKLPQRLLPFLRRMTAEFDYGRRTAGTFAIEEKSYSLVPMENRQYQLRFSIPNSSQFNDIIMSANELKQLVTIVEIVNILITRQRGRCLESDQEYPKLLEELMGWATAKVVYVTVAHRMGPGRRPQTQQEYDNLWEEVKRESYTLFLDDVERFARRIKVMLPIDDPYLTSYNDKYVSTGFRFSKPVHEYEPLQLLVDILHTPGRLIPAEQTPPTGTV